MATPDSQHLMRLRVTLAFALLVICWRPCHATTWRTIEIKCPIDDTRMKAHIPGSTFVGDVAPDGRVRRGVDMFLAGIVQCPSCGFAASHHEFEDKTGIQRDKLKSALQELRTPQLFRKFDAAITVERTWRNRPTIVAKLSLAAKWCADDTGEADLINNRLNDAIKFHVVAVDAPDLPKLNRAMLRYLVGELHRQRGAMDEAIRWFDAAAADADDDLKTLIDQQRFDASVENKTPAEILALAQNGSAGGKLATIPLLRTSNDADVLAFLKRFCLAAPDELRDRAMDALIGEQALGHHLPIFLEALESTHFRTVQGGARGVQALRAKAAAPIIVRALQKPVPATDYRLWAALGAVATEAEIDAIPRIPDFDRHAQSAIAAFISTKSPKAVSHALTLIQEEGSSFFDDEVAIQDAREFPELLARLPDLRAKDVDGGAAYFKMYVLAGMKDEASANELAAATHRGDTVGLLAARALAARGDKRGKPQLVAQLKESMRRDQIGATPVLPYLEPSDYPVIRKALEDEIAARQEFIERLREDLAAEKDEERKRVLQVQFNQRAEDSEWWMERWLPLLGATRHPEAWPTLLKYADAPNHQAREGAMNGLGYFASDEAIRLLIAKATAESDEHVRHTIVRALGRTKSDAAIGALLRIIETPTAVGTKLAWIDAMTTLAPEKAAPFLQKWKGSPNRALAVAVEKALKK